MVYVCKCVNGPNNCGPCAGVQHFELIDTSRCAQKAFHGFTSTCS